MTYNLVLVGNKTISITEEQKKKLDTLLLNKDEGERVVMLGNTTIKVSSIRGIFESNTVSYQPNDEKFQKELLEWDADCKRLSELPIEEKIERELRVRIFPEALISRSWIDTRVDEVYEQVKRVVTDFYIANPRYPRCPARYWFPIIKPYVHIKAAKFYEIVGINDEALFNWAKNRDFRTI